MDLNTPLLLLLKACPQRPCVQVVLVHKVSEDKPLNIQIAIGTQFIRILRLRIAEILKIIQE